MRPLHPQIYLVCLTKHMWVTLVRVHFVYRFSVFRCFFARSLRSTARTPDQAREGERIMADGRQASALDLLAESSASR
jgi:hypothetical protein